MTMLSRVADRLYWMARYLERAEDTARLTQSYTHLIMDIPEGSEPGWDILVNILDAQTTYGARYRAFNEQNVLRFLIADADNPGSIRNVIQMARENVRTTRDVLPSEVWEQVNYLHLYAQEWADKSVGRRNRHRFLDQIIGRCQLINGLMMTTLVRDHAYRFIKLGHMLERADMTTRVIDVGVGALLGDQRHHSSVDPLIWASVLQSLSAMGTYRRTIGPLVEVNEVVDFVFRNDALPRSVRFCLNGIRAELGGLSNNRDAMKLLDHLRRRLARFRVHDADREQLHRFIDSFQLGLNELSDTFTTSWFLPEQS